MNAPTKADAWAQLEAGAQAIPKHMRAGYLAGARLALDHLETMAAETNPMPEADRVAFWRSYLSRIVAPLFILADEKAARAIINAAVDDAKRAHAHAKRAGAVRA